MKKIFLFLLFFASAMLSYGQGWQLYMALSGGTDPDAAKFITAMGITNATQKKAINYEASYLKANGIWTKLSFFHPHIGGTATAHSGNLKDARQVNAAYYITWSNAPTFDGTGTKGNGTSQYGDTHFTPNTLPANNIGIGVYVGTDLGSGNGHCLMGCANSGAAQTCEVFLAVTYNGGIGDAATLLPAYAQSHTNGLWSVNRTSSTSEILWYGATNVSSNSTANSGSVSTRTLYELARNGDGTATNFSTLTVQGDYAGTGLTATDIANLNTMFIYVNGTILSR